MKLDISRNKETIPVPLYNDVDLEEDLAFFIYCARPVYPPGAAIEAGFRGGPGLLHLLCSSRPVYPPGAAIEAGCDCMPECSTNCLCKTRNHGAFAYYQKILLGGRPVIYECGDSCSCPMTCPNCVTGRGLRHQLEVFRSRQTLWGVRSLDPIQAGEFICEYSGEIVPVLQCTTKRRKWIDPKDFIEQWEDWGDVSDAIPNQLHPEFSSLSEPNYSLDVSAMRNVACYISHSCQPNVFVQFVLYNHNV